MYELAVDHMSPLEVWAVTRVQIFGAATTRLAAHLHAFEHGARTKIVDRIERLANTVDPFARLIDCDFEFFCHGA